MHAPQPKEGQGTGRLINIWPQTARERRQTEDNGKGRGLSWQLWKKQFTVRRSKTRARYWKYPLAAAMEDAPSAATPTGIRRCSSYRRRCSARISKSSLPRESRLHECFFWAATSWPSKAAIWRIYSVWSAVTFQALRSSQCTPGQTTLHRRAMNSWKSCGVVG